MCFCISCFDSRYGGAHKQRFNSDGTGRGKVGSSILDNELGSVTFIYKEQDGMHVVPSSETVSLLR